MAKRLRSRIANLNLSSKLKLLYTRSNSQRLMKASKESDSDTTSLLLTAIPLEIRLLIYRAVFSEDISDFYIFIDVTQNANIALITDDDPLKDYVRASWDTRMLLLVCKQIYQEALLPYYSSIRLSLPKSDWKSILEFSSNSYIRNHLRRTRLHQHGLMIDQTWLRELSALREILLGPKGVSLPCDSPDVERLRHSDLKKALVDTSIDCYPQNRVDWEILRQLVDIYPNTDFILRTVFYLMPMMPSNSDNPMSTHLLLFNYNFRTDIFTQVRPPGDERATTVIKPEIQ